MHNWQAAVGSLRQGFGPARQLRRVCDRIELDPKVIVELGTFEGVNARKLRMRFPRAVLHLVDAWQRLRAAGKGNRRNPTQDHWDRMFERVAGYFEGDHNAHLIRALTHDAAARFTDESLDIVYIDADHRYASVVEDIRDWFPKVRVGGLLAGHDYKPNWRHTQVKRAVNELIGKDRIMCGPHRIWIYRKCAGEVLRDGVR